MDVGADEFEQSLPLLQELVLGADFVGKTPGFRALSPEPLAGRSCGGCGAGRTGRRGEAQPGGRLSAGGSERPSEGQGDSFSAWAGRRKQQLAPRLCCGPGEAEPTEGGGGVVLALVPSFSPLDLTPPLEHQGGEP